MTRARTLLLALCLAARLPAEEARPAPTLDGYYEAIRQVERIKLAAGQDHPQLFIREYSYQAGDDDSRNTARTKCLDYVRKELLDEIGVYLQSDFLRQVTTTQGPAASSYQEIVRHQIKELSAGITELKVLEESWDGKTYHVKAAITLDPDSVRAGIMLALKGRVNDAEVLRLNDLVNQQDVRLQAASARFRDAQDRLVAQQLYSAGVEQRIAELESKLEVLKGKVAVQEAQEQAARFEVDAILARIQDLTDQALGKIKLNMTEAEVRQLLGPPRAVGGNRTAGGHDDNYGYAWIRFQDGLAVGYKADASTIFRRLPKD